jgi:enoyl-CoA hydratase/carnithine racemase
MSYTEIIFEKAEKIATITLNRPERGDMMVFFHIDCGDY